MRSGMLSAPDISIIGKEPFFGRVKGRPVGQAEALALKRTSLLLSLEDCREDPKKLFSVPVDFIHLEIGFGAGEHLIARARENSRIGFIGAEVFHNGIAKCAFAAEEAGLKNLRIFPFDARPLLDILPSQSLAAVHLLYPDPWPKRRHYKRRIINDVNLKKLAQLLQPGGRFYFTSDFDNYTAWALSHLLHSEDFIWNAQQAADWQTPYAGWISTRYEQKALREGRKPCYLTFVRH